MEMIAMSLDQLKPGEIGIIISIAGAVAVRRRLLDMGIRKGETIKMIKAAPLRDPLQISLSGGHISIRRSEASLIQIEIKSDKFRE
jgi:Fe2+ transport system protein FeoA